MHSYQQINKNKSMSAMACERCGAELPKECYWCRLPTNIEGFQAHETKLMCPTMRENSMRSPEKFSCSQLQQKFNQALAIMSEEERREFFEENARIATPPTHFEPPNLARILRALIDELDEATVPNKKAKKAVLVTGQQVEPSPVTSEQLVSVAHSLPAVAQYQPRIFH